VAGIVEGEGGCALMTKGELEYAIRQALNNFDKWIECTGALSKGTSWYYEAQGCIEDAVKIGAKIACEGIDADLSDIIEK
jgi:hypothetical protein